MATRIFSYDEFNIEAIRRSIKRSRELALYSSKNIPVVAILMSSAHNVVIYTQDYIQQLVSKAYPKKNYKVRCVTYDDLDSPIMFGDYLFDIYDDTYINTYKDYIRKFMNDIFDPIIINILNNVIIPVKFSTIYPGSNPNSNPGSTSHPRINISLNSSSNSSSNSENNEIYLATFHDGLITSHEIHVKTFIAGFYSKQYEVKDDDVIKALRYFRKMVFRLNKKISLISPKFKIMMVHDHNTNDKIIIKLSHIGLVTSRYRHDI